MNIRYLSVFSLLFVCQAVSAQVTTLVPGDTSIVGFSIDPNVTLTPSSISDFPLFDIGPINGINYSIANQFIAGSGGGTDWVNVSYLAPASEFSSFFLFFMVTDIIDESFESGLAIDNIFASNESIFESFETGIPGTWNTFSGTRITTSGSTTGIAPTDGTSFAILDTFGTLTDTSAFVNGVTGSMLQSTTFTLGVGDTLSFDAFFLSNDGLGFNDYALGLLFSAGANPFIDTPAAVLYTATAPVPEPRYTVLSIGLAALMGAALLRRRKRQAV